MKLEYVVAYKNSSDKFDTEHCPIKVKVTVDLQIFSPFTTIQTVRSYNSTLAQSRKLIAFILCGQPFYSYKYTVLFVNATIGFSQVWNIIKS